MGAPSEALRGAVTWSSAPCGVTNRPIVAFDARRPATARGMAPSDASMAAIDGAAVASTRTRARTNRWCGRAGPSLPRIGRRNAESSQRNDRSSQGKVDSNQGNVGSTRRNVDSTERNVGSTERNVGSTERGQISLDRSMSSTNGRSTRFHDAGSARSCSASATTMASACRGNREGEAELQHGRKGPAMVWREPVRRQAGVVLRRSVAGVGLPAIVRMPAGEGAHQPVARDLGHDGCAGDGVAAGIAADDGRVLRRRACECGCRPRSRDRG